MTQTSRHSLLLLLAVIASLAYLGSEFLRPFPLSYAIKATPAIALALWVYSNTSHPKRMWLLGAFVFAAIGDIILDFGHFPMLAQGLMLFALTQLALINLMRQFPANRPRWQWTSLAPGTPIFLWLIWPYLDERAPLLAAYSVLLTLMVMMAFRANLNKRTQVGALLFLISDSLIAIDTFVWHSQLGMSTIFATYFAAIILLAHGLVDALNHASQERDTATEVGERTKVISN